jgi:hypothetical protein
MMVGSPEIYNPEKVFNLKQKEIDEYIKNMETILDTKINSNDEYFRLYNQYWNTFNGNGDFAHMAYTISAHFVSENANGVSENYSIIWNTLWDNHETRIDITGWLGDATISGNSDWQRFWKTGTTSFGPDDYIADLDAVNIANRVNESISIAEAMNSYYADLAKDDKVRVQEFLNNTPYDKIESEILTRAGAKTLDALKKKWPDSYNFLMNLKNENSVMYDYTK